ncbi:MAG: PQ-loop repeat-containing protein [Candidatus Eremiobacteraeota bacterium]|nr:PQ-loop repeat-containing protein [Candidatus Eremiobacteraeota bacterium]
MIEILGYIATVVVAATQVPQLVKTVRTHDVEGLSRRTYALIVLGSALYVPYGVAIHSIPIVITNAWVVVVAGTIFGYIVRYGG